jgi:hypothetical protein
VVPLADRDDDGVPRSDREAIVTDRERATAAIDREDVEVVVTVPRQAATRRDLGPVQGHLRRAARRRGEARDRGPAEVVGGMLGRSLDRHG